VEIHGVIRDREGAGIEGINVYIDDRSWNATNNEGAFRVRVKPGRYRVFLGGFRVRVPGADMDTVVVGPSGTRLDYQYGGFKIEGRLVGPGGRAIRDGVVQAFGDSPDIRYGIYVGSRLKRGRYVLFVPRGIYYFKTEPFPEYYPATDRGARPPAIRIDADTTIDFPAGGHAVEGRITLRGRPLSGATVDAYGVSWPDTAEIRARSATTSNGRYRLFVPNGHYTFFISRGPELSPFVTRWFQREITGPERIETNLSMTFWSGVVRDSVTGAPVESVSVWAGDPINRYSFAAMSRSDREGRFRLEMEPGRRYSLSWSKGKVAPREFASAVAVNDSTLAVRVAAGGR